jgi:peptidoglycan/LPS O-acetylase OafA/YrhL
VPGEPVLTESPERSHAVPSSGSYRADLDGLRAISVLLVIAFHAGITQLAGGFIGVDVFFVISGFLITGILLAEATKTRSISLRNFYARRIRRLLPLSALVLVATVLAGIVFVPALDRGRLLGDARSAALYFSNWRFAGQATAYADIGPGDSLFVHYWSLSIEEQFYLVWPLIILVTTMLVARRKPERLRLALGSVLSVVAVSSFVLSIVLTRVQGQSAYYGTHLRLGELATGAALAVAVGHVGRLRGLAARIAGVAGIACIVLAATLYDRTTPFPGSAVLLPVFGAALVIASGVFRPTGVGRLLGRPPLPAIGRISYAWYLWHWPALGITSLALGENASPTAKTFGTILAVVASLALAIGSHHLLENPIRFSERLKRSWRRGLALGLALTAVSVGTTMLPTPVAATRPVTAEGKHAMTPEEARLDTVQGMGRCHIAYRTTSAASGCVFGDPAGDKTIALVGDSIAQQWFPAFERVARANHWRLLAWTKDACVFIDVLIHVGPLNRPYYECVTWRRNVINRMRSFPGGVDLVVVGRSTYALVNVLTAEGKPIASGTLDTVWAQAAARTFSRLRAVADHVILIPDTPLSPHDVPSCLSEFPSEPDRCRFPRKRVLERGKTLTTAERETAPPGVEVIDLSGSICPSDPCPVVTAGGVIIYRDTHHMSATFSATLAPVIERMVIAALSS